MAGSKGSRTAGTGRMTLLLTALHAFALIPSFTQSHGRGFFSTTAIVFIFKHLSLSRVVPAQSPSSPSLVLARFSHPSPFRLRLTLRPPPLNATGCLAYLGSYFRVGFRFSSRKGFALLPLPWMKLKSQHVVFSNHTMTRQQNTQR